ncbi:MAG: amidohydrolase family protein [Patescibacteria group bacterium]
MSVLIKNVTVLAGDASRPSQKDIFISGNKISAIGSFPEKAAEETIDGQGGYVSPGFIDIGTTSDHYLSLFENPEQWDFLRQGVTTMIGGQCGSSLAPLLYGSLESIQKWADVSKMNIDWHTVKEFLSHVQKLRLGVNFATLTGHSTIRRGIIGEELRDLTAHETQLFEKILRQSFRDGSFGLSTGLEYIHARNTPYKELLSLASTVRAENLLYSIHLRSVDCDVEKSVDEALKLSKESQVNMLISHLVPVKGFEEQYLRILDKLDALPKERNVHFDVYPFPVSTVPIHRLLPFWMRNQGILEIKKAIRDPWMIPRIIKEFPVVNSLDIQIAYAPGNESLSGKTLKDVQEMYEIDDVGGALLHLMACTDLRAVIHIKNINGDLLKKALSHDRSLVSSHAPNFGKDTSFTHSDRSTKTFPEFLRLFLEDKSLSIERAVEKITLAPAKKLGLKKRGMLKEGNFADCAVFKDGLVRFVILGGQVVVRNGEITGIRAGETVKKHRQ